MRHLFVILCLFALSLSAVMMKAQIRPSRTWLVDMARRTTPTGPVPSMMGGAEIQRGWGSHESEQAWQLRLHAVAEPFRFSARKDTTDDTAIMDSTIAWTTSVEFHHELTANPLNNIGFNPRTARWEEQLLVHAAATDWSARAGWFHRCKHDIDNTDPPNEDTLVAFSPIRRTLILSGPTMAAFTSPTIVDKFTFRSAIGVEYFVINEDYRTPATPDSGSWNGMQGALWVQSSIIWMESEQFGLTSQYHVTVPWFSSRFGTATKNTIPVELRGEICASFFSASSAMDFVVSVEHSFDEVAFLSATPTSQIQIGLRFRSR